jgi:hypothetical protein
MSRRGLLLLGLLGAWLVVLARGVVPLAPPLYDGITVAPEPFRYVSPPPDLASTNKPPASGQGDLQVATGINKLATVQTDDKQVLAFFPEGALSTTAAKITIKITPQTSPPPPPSGNKLIGNVYGIEEVGVTPQPPLSKPSQVLLRIPAQKLSSVKEYYDNAWHDTQWSVQTDYINLSMDHLGFIAAFDDGQHSQAAPAPAGSFNPIGVIEAGLVVVAIAIVVAGIVVQRRRGRAEAKAAAKNDRKGGAKAKKAKKADKADWGPKGRS